MIVGRTRMEKEAVMMRSFTFQIYSGGNTELSGGFPMK